MGRFKYQIDINLIDSKQPEKILYEGTSFNENGKSDDISITNKKIQLICERSSEKELSKILTDYNSTINIQLSKAISFLSAINEEITTIESIVIKKYDRGIFKDSYEHVSINQPVPKQIQKELLFNKDTLDVLFDGSKKSFTILIAISYWIKAVTAQQPGECYDRLWTGFNSLYSYLSPTKNREIDKLAEVRNFILNNESFFQTSTNIFDTFDDKKIRELQWRNLILNDHENYNNTESFYFFIKRYTDFRINQVFKQTLVYRKDFLASHNLLNDTVNHIENNIKMGNKKNSELLAFYTLKYAYFIRNKYFHGEKIDPTFHLVKNDDINELDLINNILTIFLKELISCNKYY
ncbi:hypothetical protein [Bacillus sp. USDA818B3_A]|uniref:hypothetical protein n=1 Tax=Bacillus sp. USDA818B3_A TaxID=2698834 RepID=UPI00136C1972|nr:hypothetical protein [Bacillus sp. USDA818B3_A]